MSVIEKDDGEWRIQVSIKHGRGNQHMTNVRGKDWAEIDPILLALRENAETIKDTIAALEELPSAPSFPASVPAVPVADVRATPPPQTNGKEEKGQEIGPMVVSKVDVVNGVSGPDSKNPGKAWVRYDVIFGGGAVKASTFDGSWGQAAMNLLGKQAYPRVLKKGKWGYDLVSIRTAA